MLMQRNSHNPRSLSVVVLSKPNTQNIQGLQQIKRISTKTQIISCIEHLTQNYFYRISNILTHNMWG